MLKLLNITITQFKNYDFSSFDFEARVAGICGANGRGKTNLLDAIYYCCFTRSYFNSSDLASVGIGLDGFRLQAKFLLNGEPEEVIAVVRQGARKEFTVNGVPYEKLSSHLGRLPVVMIAPDDIALVTEGAEFRRKYIDSILSQLYPEYLQQLITYNKLLQQRNSLLKNYHGNTSNSSLLEILDDQLCVPAAFIHNKRKQFTEELFPRVALFYNFISDHSEPLEIKYESQLLQSEFSSLLASNRFRDIQSQRTNAGIHRDDIGIFMNGKYFRQIASQGQKKSQLFALKLAEFELIREKKGFAPLLLLDDIFEKLDESRMKRLLNRVCAQNDGQVFITDTHCERLGNSLRETTPEHFIINL